jgi:hypothetical protein
MKKRISAMLGLLLLASSAIQRIDAEGRSPFLFAELSAGPLLGVDKPLKGGEGGALVGLRWEPFEAGLRAGAAYDGALEGGAFRLDLTLGLGQGLRAIVGALLPLGDLSLPAPDGSGTLRVEPAGLPCRFGLGSTVAELHRRFFGARFQLCAELVYTAYRLADAPTASTTSLAGAAAFAAGLEATLALRLRWGDEDKSSGRGRSP